jgi:DNA replication protein DnaC
MHPIPELTPLLKQLRLSGILDSLEARNREAIDRKLAFTEFLSLLIHDEVARRDNKKLSLRMRRANFRSQKTLEGFDFDRLPGLNRAAIHDLATCRFIDEKVAVLIAGPCGTGKVILRKPSDTLQPGKDTMCCSQHKANYLRACAARQPWALTTAVSSISPGFHF